MFELDKICTSMVFRATAIIGLEKSICSLMPKFSEQLVLSAMEDARETNCAVGFYNWVEREGLYKHTRATHMKLIEKLVRDSKPNPARARGMVIGLPSKGVEWDEEMFVLLIEGYGKIRNVQESAKIFRAMKELGVDMGVCSYDALFKVSLRHGKCLLAKKYYNQMLQEGIAPTRQTFNVLLWGFFRCQDEETGMRIYEDMMSRGIEPNVVTYNAMISGFIRLKKFEEAEKLFVEMKGKKIAPTVITYSSMIYCYFSSGKVKDAYRQYFEMMRAGIKPNGVTFTTLSSGRCNAMELPEPEVVSKEVLERSADPKNYSVFISLLNYMCRSGQFGEAVRVLRAMIRLNIPTEAAHFGILIENFCNTKGYDRAVKYVDELIEKGIILMPGSTLDTESSSYNGVTEYVSNGRETKKADDLYRQLMHKDVQDSVAFNDLLRGDTKKVDRSDADSRLSLFCEIYLVKRGVTDQKSIASVI